MEGRDFYQGVSERSLCVCGVLLFALFSSSVVLRTELVVVGLASTLFAAPDCLFVVVVTRCRVHCSCLVVVLTESCRVRPPCLSVGRSVRSVVVPWHFFCCLSSSCSLSPSLSLSLLHTHSLSLCLSVSLSLSLSPLPHLALVLQVVLRRCPIVVACVPPPTTNRQPPTTNHQPTTGQPTNHQPPTPNHSQPTTHNTGARCTRC
jgi:hypothetical protein